MKRYAILLMIIALLVSNKPVFAAQPTAYIEAWNCASGYITGYASDPDYPSANLLIRADIYVPPVYEVISQTYTTNGNFQLSIPVQYRYGTSINVRVYDVNTKGQQTGTVYLIGTVNCPAQTNTPTPTKTKTPTPTTTPTPKETIPIPTFTPVVEVALATDTTFVIYGIVKSGDIATTGFFCSRRLPCY